MSEQPQSVTTEKAAVRSVVGQPKFPVGTVGWLKQMNGEATTDEPLDGYLPEDYA